ncbi:hypothetical protein T12_2691 [Trichinella patagoniensis]|uniref:Uncharacterized protein n=1 Tax=Trichinella patagoniensis TaxID=990121 RepID=A0A0V0ZBH6_9BILA|nr:hypothetical protein T12_2691 [Trichinella patagoniensis]
MGFQKSPIDPKGSILTTLATPALDDLVWEICRRETEYISDYWRQSKHLTKSSNRETIAIPFKKTFHSIAKPFQPPDIEGHHRPVIALFRAAFNLPVPLRSDQHKKYNTVTI